MASYEATEVTSAPTRGPLYDILREDNIFLNPSQWGAEQIDSLRIQLVDAEQSNKPVPGDPTLAVEIDTDALAKLFKQRDEHDPGCYSINQAISTAIEALEHRNIAQNHRRHWFQVGNRRCVISASSYFMINEISAVAVDNPANVYVRRQHRKTPDETISYFSGAVEGEVHPVNIAQLIILAQGQEMAMKQGSISNMYPLTVCTEPSTIIRVPANNCRWGHFGSPPTGVPLRHTLLRCRRSTSTVSSAQTSRCLSHCPSTTTPSKSPRTPTPAIVQKTGLPVRSGSQLQFSQRCRLSRRPKQQLIWTLRECGRATGSVD